MKRMIIYSTEIDGIKVVSDGRKITGYRYYKKDIGNKLPEFIKYDGNLYQRINGKTISNDYYIKGADGKFKKIKN